MTSYGLLHHSSKSSTSLRGDAYRQSSFWTVARMPCGKNGKRQHDTEWRIYYLDDVLPLSSPRWQILRWRSEWRLTTFLTTAANSSLALTRGRLTFPVIVTLSFNRHSERWQECCSRKTGNRTVTQSKESMILMTSYRFPHHRYRAFTFASDDV